MSENRLARVWGCCVLAAVLGNPSVVHAQPAPETARVGTVQLLVWNRTGQTIDVDVRVGGQPVYTSRVRKGTVAASIEGGRVVQREPGTYVVQVIDRTRKVVDSVSVQIGGEQGQNVGVQLTREGVAFFVTRGDVTRHTPPPATEDGSTGGGMERAS